MIFVTQKYFYGNPDWKQKTTDSINDMHPKSV